MNLDNIIDQKILTELEQISNLREEEEMYYNKHKGILNS